MGGGHWCLLLGSMNHQVMADLRMPERNDFVNECPLKTVVPIAAKFACGVVESVVLV